MLKNFAVQIKQRLDITDSCSRYSLDRILVVLHNADMDEAREFATRLARELKAKDLLNSYEGSDGAIRISAGYAQADEDSLIKEVLARAPARAKASNVSMHKGTMVACLFVPRQTACQAFIKFFSIQLINYLVDDGSILEIYFSIPV